MNVAGGMGNVLVLLSGPEVKVLVLLDGSEGVILEEIDLNEGEVGNQVVEEEGVVAGQARKPGTGDPMATGEHGEITEVLVLVEDGEGIVRE